MLVAATTASAILGTATARSRDAGANYTPQQGVYFGLLAMLQPQRPSEGITPVQTTPKTCPWTSPNKQSTNQIVVVVVCHKKRSLAHFIDSRRRYTSAHSQLRAAAATQASRRTTDSSARPQSAEQLHAATAAATASA